MLRRSFYILLLLVFVAAPITVLGNDMPIGKWWHRPAMASKLNLSDAEKSKLDQSYIESHRNLIKLKNVVESQRFELEVLLETEPLDEAKVLEQNKRVEKARSELAQERFRYILEVRKIIGHDRFQELKASFQKFRRQRARRMMAPAEKRAGKGSAVDE
ncbi:MAG: periplasmic heavy metal sensor [Desulfobacterales bacterium]|jgi:Spy/CpxP family protein refolding chaperone